MGEIFVPSSESLLQRGYFFLARSEFKTALLYFNRVLDITPNAAEAYWGLLLCEYQCKESKELYERLAVPIGNNSNFHYAVENANQELQKEYRETEQLVLLACHRKTVKNALEGNRFLATKWKKHYSSANSENKLFEEDNKNILAISKTDDAFPKFLLSLYAKYQEIPFGTDIINSLKELVKKEYATAMGERLKKMLEKPQGIGKEEISLWANPLSASFSAEKTDDIGLDGNPSSVSERFAFMAKELSSKKGSLAIYKNIHYCYSCAMEHENKESYATDKKAYFEAEIAKDGVSKEEVDYIISLYPEVGKFYWQYVLIQTKNLTKMPVSYVNDSDVSAFMKKTKEQYTEEDIGKLLGKQKDSKISLERDYEAMLNTVIPYAEKAIKYSRGEETAAFSQKWTAYKDALLENKKESLNAIDKRIREITDKEKTDNKQGAGEAHKKGILLSIVSVLILALSIPVGLFIKYSFHSIGDLIKYPLIYVYLLALVAFLIISIIQIVTTKKICQNRPKKFKLPIYYRIITKAVSVLSIIILPLSVGLLVYSYIQYPNTVGEITIQSVEDFVYLKNAPRGRFSLETNLDFTNTEVVNIPAFRGTLLGNEHTVSHLKLSEDGFIKNNSGEISDLTFVSPSSEENFNVILKNSGTLNNIVLSDVVLETENDFKGIVGTNNGKLVSCKVNEVSGACDDFVGMCERNEGEIVAGLVNNVTIKCNSADGFAGLNRGTIIGCSFSGKLDGTSSVNGFVGNISGKDARVERCSATGTIKGGQSVSAFIGSIDEGRLENSYSRIEATQVCCEYNDSIGGLVREISPDDKTNITIKNCYFGGNITILPSKESKTFEIVGGLIGAAATSHSVNDYTILVDSCFNVGTYALSRVSKGTGWSTTKNSITLNNTYGLRKDDIGYANLEGELTIKGKSSILSAKFITDTLGWDSEIWNIKTGQYPTLKEYVVTTEPPEKTSSLSEEA